MIAAQLEDICKYNGIAAGLETVSKYIANSPTTEPGQWMNISETARVILLDSDSYEDGIFETHERFLDVHVTLSGCDRMEVCNISKLTLFKTYDESRDFALWTGKPQAEINIYPNNFLLLMPHDGHNSKFLLPGTKKLVFKILADG